MSKSRKTLDNKQITIFEYLQKLSEQCSPIHHNEGKFNIIDELRTVLRCAIKASPLSRHQIAGEISHLAGESITKEVIDSWTRESDEINGRPGRHIPAEYLPAFCKVTGCNEALAIMGKMAGLFVLPGPEALRAEIQKLTEQELAIKAEKRKRKMFLKEMEKQPG